jgi:hypothetical protein
MEPLSKLFLMDDPFDLPLIGVLLKAALMKILEASLLL